MRRPVLLFVMRAELRSINHLEHRRSHAQAHRAGEPSRGSRCCTGEDVIEFSVRKLPMIELRVELSGHGAHVVVKEIGIEQVCNPANADEPKYHGPFSIGCVRLSSQGTRSAESASDGGNVHAIAWARGKMRRACSMVTSQITIVAVQA